MYPIDIYARANNERENKKLFLTEFVVPFEIWS